MTDYHPKNETEEWRPVVGHEGRYEVSSHGRVRSFLVIGSRGERRRSVPYLLKLSLDNHGYPCVKLSGTVRRAHRLVLEAFRGPGPNLDGSHLNGQPSDNRLDNLVWEPHRSNEMRKADHGTRRRGSQAAGARLTESNVLEIRKRYAAGETVYGLADQFGVTFTTIHAVVIGRSWKHVGGPIIRRRSVLS